MVHMNRVVGSLEFKSMAVWNSSLWLPEVFLCAFGNKIHKQQVTYTLYINIQFMVVSYIIYCITVKHEQYDGVFGI